MSLCIKTERTLRNDFTVAHDRKLYQTEEAVTTKKLVVEDYTNGAMAILCREENLKFREIVVRPGKPLKQRPLPRMRKVSIPAKGHPWRGLFFVPNRLKTKAA